MVAGHAGKFELLRASRNDHRVGFTGFELVDRNALIGVPSEIQTASDAQTKFL